MAKKIPGKDEFGETLRYFESRLAKTGVEVRCGHRVVPSDLTEGFDRVVVATGVTPRQLTLPGHDHPKVLSYIDVLRHETMVGNSVAIIGAGGIGFDVAEFLTHGDHGHSPIDAYLEEWGVDRALSTRGGLKDVVEPPPPRQVYLCQRRVGKLGAKLGKTTGWIHRSSLKKRKVEMLAECVYHRIDDEGLHLSVGGVERVLDVDHVVICAGQVSERSLAAPLEAAGVTVDVIGGAHEAGELDARRAIDQGTRMAAEV